MTSKCDFCGTEADVIQACAHCGAKVCVKHLGNQYTAPAGGWVSCTLQRCMTAVAQRNLQFGGVPPENWLKVTSSEEFVNVVFGTLTEERAVTILRRRFHLPKGEVAAIIKDELKVRREQLNA